VVLNADGKQYTASYQIRCGVITVTFGSASRIVRVGEAVAAPESVARTILRAMVRENCPPSGLKREPATVGRMQAGIESTSPFGTQGPRP
jgi:hypothetical protein